MTNPIQESSEDIVSSPEATATTPEVERNVSVGTVQRERPDDNTPLVLAVEDLAVYYGDFRAVSNVNMPIRTNEVTALIGPSGCGKSTVLRCFNRMNDLIESARVEGSILYHGVDLYGAAVDPVEVRRRIGMVFQKPNPFPKSIYDNIAYGPRIAGIKKKSERDDIVD